MQNRLKDIVNSIPFDPGIYLMKNEDGKVIYVGKAKSLRKRVRQYFNSSAKSMRIQKMVEKIYNIEYIVTHNELEALALECNYIKEYSPKYNVMLKDDKNYPYIKITIKDKYPSMYIVRQRKDDGSLYFGPYTDVYGIRELFNSLKEIFPLKRCNLNLNSKSSKKQGPCLYYHIGKCLAPCINDVQNEEYNKMIKEIIMFLDGKTKQIEDVIKKDIDNKINELKFEEAAILKARLDKLTSVLAKQTVANLNENKTDIWGYKIISGHAYIQIFKIRDGKLSKHDSLELESAEKSDFSFDLGRLICSYYESMEDIPKKVFYRASNKDETPADLIQEYLSKIAGTSVLVHAPVKGDKLNLIKMIENNIEVKHGIYKEENALKALSELLEIDEITSIESYDISNLKNDYIVGCSVTYEGTGFNKKKYRKYKIKSVRAQNDIECMREMLTRRLKHISDWELPSLILMDGGINQINVARDVLDEHNIYIPVVGMVKDDKHKTKGIITQINKEIELNTKEHREVFKLVTRIQDEVHRFAITYHRSLRDKIK